MVANLIYENVWTDKAKYDDAECQYYERLAKVSLTPLADEVAKARQRLTEIRGTIEHHTDFTSFQDVGVSKLEKKIEDFEKTILSVLEKINILESRVLSIEENLPKLKSDNACSIVKQQCKKQPAPSKPNDDDDDGVDLFGSDSEDDEAANKIREERLAAYNQKKSKKAAVIAKSNIILDVKPWDDDTNMEEMEKGVRKIETDGLLWGAAQLVPLAYGIHKLQICCVIEDDKVSVDWLQEQIESIEDYVQSVDIAAFNKI